MKQYADVLIEFKVEKRMFYLNEGKYMPHFRIIGDIELLGVRFVECINSPVTSGEIVEAKVLLMYYPEVDYSKLVEGIDFEIVEGNNTVGNGKVIKRY